MSVLGTKARKLVAVLVALSLVFLGAWGCAPGARKLGRVVRRVGYSAKRRFGLLSALEILPYRGYGTPREVFFRGRVLEERGITRAGQDAPVYRNILNMVRRFTADAVGGARVRASFGGLETEVVADEGGYFEVRFELPLILTQPAGWHPMELELLSPAPSGAPSRGGRARSTGWVLVPGDADLGIVSDLDDTVVLSRATNYAKLLWIVFSNNARTRLPFEGVATFYRGLQRGLGGDGGRVPERAPIFYVSSSPWDIYDVLEDFLRVHGVPAGPMFLKDFSLFSVGEHEGHKMGAIRTLFETYPGMSFVLIGDSGQEDPEIYLRAAREYPGRVRVIYVRDVTTPERDREVKGIASEARGLGVEMVLVADTASAAGHAAAEGLISAEAAAEVSASSGGNAGKVLRSG